MTYEEFSESVVVEPILNNFFSDFVGVELRLSAGARYDYANLKEHGMEEDEFVEFSKRSFYERMFQERVPQWLLSELNMDEDQFIRWCRQARRDEEERLWNMPPMGGFHS